MLVPHEYFYPTGTEDACRAQEKGEQTGGIAIRGAQVGRTLASSIEDQQLMPDPARIRQPRNGFPPAVPVGPP